MSNLVGNFQFCLSYLITYWYNSRSATFGLAQPFIVFIVPPYYWIPPFLLRSKHWVKHRFSIFIERLLCKILNAVCACLIIERELDSIAIINFFSNYNTAIYYYKQNCDHFDLNEHSGIIQAVFWILTTHNYIQNINSKIVISEFEGSACLEAVSQNLRKFANMLHSMLREDINKKSEIKEITFKKLKE